jgi:hypothetical protein
MMTVNESFQNFCEKCRAPVSKKTGASAVAPFDQLFPPISLMLAFVAGKKFIAALDEGAFHSTQPQPS